MHRLVLLIIILFQLRDTCLSQNISGVINNYAAVTNISGTSLVVNTATAFASGDRILLIQMKGATITTSNNATFGDITSMGGAGTYEFLDVAWASGTVIAVTSSPTHTYNYTTGFTQVVRVPKYCMPTVTSTLTCAAWSGATGMGGILAFEAGTLTLNSEIDVNAMGFSGGNFASSSFCCSNGNYVGAAFGNGGQKGESISAYITNLDGLKGKQANGGGAANCGNSGGGGGGNAGAGGIGGNQYSGCGTFDDRGIGGAFLTQGFTTMFMGGGGGGGFKDNGQSCTAGANGGGIIYIRANLIICNSRTVTASGGGVTTIINDEGAGGGGGGGTIFIECPSFTGNLIVKAEGGIGGSNNNSLFTTNCHGPGGGGGGGIFGFTPASLPGGFITSFSGGAAGTVNNAASSCFATTFGAAGGVTGTLLPGLPSIIQSFNIPTLTVSQSNTICTGQTATLTVTGASTYSWNTGPTTSLVAVTPLTGTQYSVVGYNGTCSASAVYSLPVTPGPTLLVSGTPSICTGQTATISASGATNYLWSTGATTNSISTSPGVTITYTVTGSASGCSTTATHSVNVTTMPTVAITGTPGICNGQTVTLTASSASNYSWSTGATTNTIAVSPTVGTNYSVIGSNGACSVTATRFMNVIPVPTLIVSGSNTLCAGTSVTVGVSGANSYVWSTGSASSSITITPPTTGITSYTITGTSNGCSSSYTHSLSVIPMPTVAISGNSHICSGQSATLSAFYAYAYTWNTGATVAIISVSPSVSTTYSLIGANGACTVSATKVVSVTPSPVVIASALSLSVCSGNTTQLTASGAASYLWNTGSTNTVVTVAPLSTSVYSLYGTSNNCTTLSQITISVVPTPSLPTGSYSLCLGVSQATMIATGATTYSWSPYVFLSSTTGSVVVANPPNTSTYVLQGFNGVCSSSVNVVVNTFTAPLVTIGSSADYVCKGNAVSLTGSGANALQWEPSGEIGNNTNFSVMVVPMATSVYTLLGYGGNQCVGIATKTITVLSTPVTQVPLESYVICAGQTVELTASGASNYSWSPPSGLSNNTQSVVIAMPATTQIYTLTGYNGTWPNICSSTVAVMVNVQPYSILKITAPDSICYAKRTNLLASGARDFTWTPSTFLSNAFVSNPIITPKTPIVYTITGVGTNSCPGTTTLSIGIKPAPFVYAGRDTTLNFDQSTFLNGQGDGWLYTWKGNDLSGLLCINCPQSYIHPQNSACYILEVENSYGCTARDEVCVQVTNEHGIYIPNSFSPNGDGINDLFTPLGFGVVSFELVIYNRWGERLFEGKGSFTDGPVVSWDGNYKGQRCKSDSYIYTFDYILPGSKKLRRDGEIILLNPKD